jgi:hypothetical protein
VQPFDWLDKLTNRLDRLTERRGAQPFEWLGALRFSEGRLTDRRGAQSFDWLDALRRRGGRLSDWRGAQLFASAMGGSPTGAGVSERLVSVHSPQANGVEPVGPVGLVEPAS